MQTFLPYPDFQKTARVLDDRRLFKQAVEAQQLINLITTGKTKSGRKFRGYHNHPIVKIWRCCPLALKKYYNTILSEVRRRGQTKSKLKKYSLPTGPLQYPSWLGNRHFHAAHRAALLVKNFNHYSQFNWKEKPQINYFWPVTFTAAVLHIVSQIPRGQTLSYGEVARRAGRPRAYRAVGNILNKNRNSHIPCHRVIKSSGAPGGYNLGTQKKIKKLQSERVNFDKK